MNDARWDRCIYHRGRHTEPFLREYLGEGHRRALIIAGAGFDPRSTAVSEIIASVAEGRSVGYFIREERPRPAQALVDRADEHERILIGLLPGSTVARLDIFATDNAVVGGRTAVGLINRLSFDGLTDVFVDLSALSVGVGFPVVRHLLGVTERLRLNLHLVLADEPGTDSGIVAASSDVADTVHGFKGGWGLDVNSRAALWMPQLARGKRAVLERVHQRVEPHAVCPILPFPASRPRLADELIEHFGEEFENSWQVDSSRDIVYAGERGPIDLYRTILRMDDARRRVFVEVGGSQIILSPVGSKALAIGALMAALDRDFTIMYVESLGYDVDLARLDADRGTSPGDLVHVWLQGEAYTTTGSMEANGP